MTTIESAAQRISQFYRGLSSVPLSMSLKLNERQIVNEVQIMYKFKHTNIVELYDRRFDESTV